LDFERTELELRAVDVSGVVKHLRRAAMDGDEGECVDKDEQGEPLTRPWRKSEL
jgi:hypothetical protein